MELSEKIKQIRKDNNLSQEKFAEEIGVSRQSIVKYEKGVTNPLIDVLIRICQRFNLSLDYFVKEENNDSIGNADSIDNNIIVTNDIVKKEEAIEIKKENIVKPKAKKKPILKSVNFDYKKELANDKQLLNLKKFGIIPLTILTIIIVINIVGFFIDYIWLTSIPFIFIYVICHRKYKENWYIDHYKKKYVLIKEQYKMPLSPQYRIYMELLEDGIYILKDGYVVFYCEYEDFDHHVFVVNNQTVGELLPVSPRFGDMIYTIAIYLKGNGIPYTISFPLFYERQREENAIGLINRREYTLCLNNVAMQLKQLKKSSR